MRKVMQATKPIFEGFSGNKQLFCCMKMKPQYAFASTVINVPQYYIQCAWYGQVYCWVTNSTVSSNVAIIHIIK